MRLCLQELVVLWRIVKGVLASASREAQMSRVLKGVCKLLSYCQYLQFSAADTSGVIAGFDF